MKVFQRRAMLQLIILQEIMNNLILKLAIDRSEKAYKLYLSNKLYFQALRIYKANQIVYRLLQDYQLICNSDEQEYVCNYIFHLEDWMLQFKHAELKVKNPTEVFIFERWEGAVPFQKL